jgi:hypothetical protein
MIDIKKAALARLAKQYADRQEANEALDPITCEAYSYFTNCYGTEDWLEFVEDCDTWDAVRKSINDLASIFEERIAEGRQEY